VDLKPLVLAACAACSGGKTKAVEDARHPAPIADATVVTPAVAHGYTVDTAAKTGDVQIRVEWKDTPQALRAPGPATRCGTPREPALAPTTTWGVPDVLVIVDAERGKARDPNAAPARLVLAGCAFTPRVAVTGGTVVVASATEEPSSVTFQEIARPLGGAAVAGTPRTLYLPVIGHEVAAALEPDMVYAIQAGSDDTAAVVSATTPYVGVTEASGNVVVRDVPVGTYPVRAYLPARSGGEARTVAGTVTVTAGALAEVTLDLGRS
jgi:hypothetical protein